MFIRLRAKVSFLFLERAIRRSSRSSLERFVNVFAGSDDFLLASAALAKGSEMDTKSFFTGLFSGIELPVTARPSGRTRDLIARPEDRTIARVAETPARPDLSQIGFSSTRGDSSSSQAAEHGLPCRLRNRRRISGHNGVSCYQSQKRGQLLHCRPLGRKVSYFQGKTSHEADSGRTYKALAASSALTDSSNRCPGGRLCRKRHRHPRDSHRCISHSWFRHLGGLNVRLLDRNSGSGTDDFAGQAQRKS